MIIQGTNEPIIIQFDGDTSAITDISIALYHRDNLLKKWTMSNLTIDGDVVIAPMTQEESMGFIPGDAHLEVKWIEDGVTQFAEISDAFVEQRCDNTILRSEVMP